MTCPHLHCSYWDCFYSREDAAKGRIDASISMEDCLKQVEAQFGLN